MSSCHFEGNVKIKGRILKISVPIKENVLEEELGNGSDFLGLVLNML